MNEYDWTTANADRVSCIYADNPAFRPEALAKLDGLARNDVALLNVCGSQDPWFEQNTKLAADRFTTLGGQLTVIVGGSEFPGMFTTKEQAQAAEFLVQAAGR